MHIMLSFRHWMHQMHDESLKLAQSTGHLVHEKDFWIFLAIVALIAILFSLLLLLGNDAAIEFQAFPYPM